MTAQTNPPHSRPSNRLGTGSGIPSRTRSIKLPEPLWEALEVLAKEEGVTVNRFVRRTLEAAAASEK